MSFQPSEETIRRMARRLAVLFNGGNWETHYTPKQRLIWIERARTILCGEKPTRGEGRRIGG